MSHPRKRLRIAEGRCYKEAREGLEKFVCSDLASLAFQYSGHYKRLAWREGGNIRIKTWAPDDKPDCSIILDIGVVRGCLRPRCDCVPPKLRVWTNDQYDGVEPVLQCDEHYEEWYLEQNDEEDCIELYKDRDSTFPFYTLTANRGGGATVRRTSHFHKWADHRPVFRGCINREQFDHIKSLTRAMAAQTASVKK